MRLKASVIHCSAAPLRAIFIGVVLITLTVAVLLTTSYFRSDAIGWRTPEMEIGVRIGSGQATIWHKSIKGATYTDTGPSHERLAISLDPIVRDFERTAKRQLGPFAYYAGLRTISTHSRLQAWPDTDQDRWQQQHPQRDIGEIIWQIFIPLYVPLFAGLLLCAAMGQPILRQKRRLAHGLCPTCGYDLRASKEKCPECGSPIPPKPPQVTSDK